MNHRKHQQFEKAGTLTVTQLEERWGASRADVYKRLRESGIKQRCKNVSIEAVLKMEAETDTVYAVFPRDRLYAGGRRMLQDMESTLCAVKPFHPLCPIRPHPLNQILYGNSEPDQSLLDSIEDVGILHPIIVTEAGLIISGTRRWNAYCQLLRTGKVRKEWIPVQVADDATSSEFERMLIEANRQRVKTAEQKGREFRELKRIETELAKERQKLSKERKRIETEPDMEGKENFPDPNGQARDKAADVIGMSGRTAEKLEAIIEASDAGDETASAALKEIDRKKGRGIDSAYTAVVKPKTTKDPELVASLEKSARELTDVLRRSGIAAEVTRSKSDGKFHLSWHDATAEQIQKFAGTFKEKLR